jgi:hypothetical protein
MVGGAFKFILAVIVFFVVGVIANPVAAAMFNGASLPVMGVFLCQVLAAGFIISIGRK